MPKKLILIALTFLLISLYLVIVADLYLLPSIQKDDVLTNLQTMDSAAPTSATRKVLITTQLGGRFAVAADTSIVFGKAVPITVYYTPILHKPTSVAFVQDETLQHMDTLYLSQSYSIYFGLFILTIVQVIYLLRWSKGKTTRDVFLYGFILLFAFLLCFQYFR